MPAIPDLESLTVIPVTAQPVTLMPDGMNGFTAMASFKCEGRLKDGTMADITNRVNWSLEPSTGLIATGNATVTSPGSYTVRAASGGINGTAPLQVNFAGKTYGMGFNQTDAPKLDNGSSSGAVNVTYPLDGAIFPSNFGAVTFHIGKTGLQDIARINFAGTGLDVQHYGICEAGMPGNGCYVTLPSAVTKLLVAPSAQDDITVTARLGSSGGTGFAESAPLKLAWANVALSGGLYYWTTILCPNGVCPISGYTLPAMAVEGTAIMRYKFEGDSPERELIWTDKGSPVSTPPFAGSPPAQAGTDPGGLRPAWGEGTCIGCHAISFDGKLMALSIGGSDPSNFAVLDIAGKMMYTLDQTAVDPNNAIEVLRRKRRPNFATFTAFGPGNVMVNMYRGKLTLHEVSPALAVIRDNLFSNTDELKSDPFWSPDGTRFAFTSYKPTDDMQSSSRMNGDTKTGGQIWSATADPSGPKEDAKLIVPRQPGVTSYYPAISHDGQLLVFNKSSCSGAMNPGGYGTGPCDGYDDITATLWLTDPAGKPPIELARANGGGANSNSWPRWSPDNGTFRGQKLYWLAFSSRRPYGLQVNSGSGTGAKPQLWFAAILTGSEFSSDASRPPVWLPNQNLIQATPTGNHVPQWVKFAVPIP